jgi:hypothetical protein
LTCSNIPPCGAALAVAEAEVTVEVAWLIMDEIDDMVASRAIPLTSDEGGKLSQEDWVKG